MLLFSLPFAYWKVQRDSRAFIRSGHVGLLNRDLTLQYLPWPGLSSSSSSSHSLSYDTDEEHQETKRFYIVPNEDQFKWDLPFELASYAKTQFEKFIPEKSLHDTICEVHPVPNNFNQVKKIRIFKRSIEGEK